jgi:AraC-like DNA-binding protein
LQGGQVDAPGYTTDLLNLNARSTSARAALKWGPMDPLTQRIEKRDHRVNLLTNHAHVLILLAKDDGIRMRDIALQVGITERAVQRIIEDLTLSGILDVLKEGRCNRYRIHEDNLLENPVEGMSRVGDLLRCAFPDMYHAKIH